METLDKIYIGIQEDGFIDCGIQQTSTCPNEYICKKALLEWLKEKKEWYKDTDIEPHYQKVIDKLNKM